MLSCQATQLLDFVASRGIISWRWMDELAQLESRKAELLGPRRLEVQTESVASYISAHENDMGYDECRVVLDLLKAGPDGVARHWRIFGGGYKSAVVVSWIELMEMYDSKNLELVELGVKLKRVLAELRDIQKNILECNESVSVISSKIDSTRLVLEKLTTELCHFREDFTSETPSSDLELYARQVTQDQTNKTVSRVTSLLTSDPIPSLLAKESLAPPSLSELYQWSLTVEELYGIYKTRLFENSFDKQCGLVVTQLQSLRDQLATATTIDEEQETRKMFHNLLLLQRRICKTNRRLSELEETENSLLSSVRDNSEKLNAFRSLRARLVTGLESKLKKHFPNGVSIQLPVS